jgi:hypothetical protein
MDCVITRRKRAYINVLKNAFIQPQTSADKSEGFNFGLSVLLVPTFVILVFVVPEQPFWKERSFCKICFETS